MTRRAIIVKAIAGELTSLQAADILGVTARQLRRLKRQFESGSAGNRRVGFRFTGHQTMSGHVECRFDEFPTLYEGRTRTLTAHGGQTTLFAVHGGFGRPCSLHCAATQPTPGQQDGGPARGADGEGLLAPSPRPGRTTRSRRTSPANWSGRRLSCCAANASSTRTDSSRTLKCTPSTHTYT